MTPLSSIPVLLESGAGAVSTFDIASSMQTAVTTTQNQLFSVLVIVVPSLAAITAAVVGIRFGLNWLKRLGR